jgi:hypothetical protein
MLLLGGAAVGYFFANNLIARQPWKLSYNLVANL